MPALQAHAGSASSSVVNPGANRIRTLFAELKRRQLMAHDRLHRLIRLYLLGLVHARLGDAAAGRLEELWQADSPLQPQVVAARARLADLLAREEAEPSP